MIRGARTMLQSAKTQQIHAVSVQMGCVTINKGKV